MSRHDPGASRCKRTHGFTSLPAQSSVQPVPGAGNVRSPDLSFFYSSSTLYATAEAYGAEGRRAYVRARATFDVIWPVVYMLFLAVALSWISRRLVAAPWWRRTNLVPVAAGAFDLLENVCTSVVMLRYPAPTPVAAVLAPVFTVLKWSFLTAAFVLALVGLALVARNTVAVLLRTER